MKNILRIDDWFHPDGFPISVERREPQGTFAAHSHEFAELVIVLGGEGAHLTGGETWRVAAGDVFVINAAQEHEYGEMNDLRLVNILYQPRQLKFGLSDLASVPGYHMLFTLEPAHRKRRTTPTRLRLGGVELAKVVELVESLEAELRDRGAGFAFMATAIFMRLIGLLSRHRENNAPPDNRALLRIGQALSYLEQNYRRELDLAELATIAHMAPRSFLRVFRSATGTSPLSWVLDRRINHACALLRRTDRSVTEIAFDCGFNDSNYFTRQFRKATQLSPREYRRKFLQVG